MRALQGAPLPAPNHSRIQRLGFRPIPSVPVSSPQFSAWQACTEYPGTAWGFVSVRNVRKITSSPRSLLRAVPNPHTEMFLRASPFACTNATGHNETCEGHGVLEGLFVGAKHMARTKAFGSRLWIVDRSVIRAGQG